MVCTCNNKKTNLLPLLNIGWAPWEFAALWEFAEKSFLQKSLFDLKLYINICILCWGQDLKMGYIINSMGNLFDIFYVETTSLETRPRLYTNEYPRIASNKIDISFCIMRNSDLIYSYCIVIHVFSKSTHAN